MKSFLSMLILQFVCFSIYGQVAEKIHGKNQVLKPNEYYLEQISLWKEELNKDKKNADAWFNYYKAHRNAYIVGDEDNSVNTKGSNRFKRLESIVREMEKFVPKSFEFNYIVWLNGNNNPDLFPFLERAHKISPERTEPLLSLAYYYELKGDSLQRNKFAKQYFDSGEFSPGLLYYGYNLLAGLNYNSLICTEGDKDTDAILLLQSTGFRKDIQLINFNLLLNEEYRVQLFEKLGIDHLNFDPVSTESNYEIYQSIIVEHVCQNRSKKDLYISLSVSEPYLQKNRENLYMIGLALLESKHKIDNLGILRRNIEQVYSLDYLKIAFYKDVSIGMVQQFNLNYIPGFALLSKHYVLSGQSDDAERIKILAQKIASDAKSLEKFSQYFED